MLIEVREVVGGRGDRDSEAYLPTSQIHYMVRHADSDQLLRITDLRGGKWDAFWPDVKGLVNPITHAIPGDGKTKLLICDRNRRTEEPWEIIGDTPVVGWLVRANGDIEPAVPGGLEEIQHNKWAILFPDGQVDEPLHGTFDNAEKWLTAINKKFSKPVEDDLIG